VQGAVKERLLRAYLCEGERVGDPEALVRLVAEAGLDADEARATLAGDAYTTEVRADLDEAREIGISGAPFFVLAGKYAISGAQPTEVLLGALTQAWAEVDRKPEVIAEGAMCGPEGCD
jgi:predicted DsbA family dithiol-disulfide isomerase